MSRNAWTAWINRSWVLNEGASFGYAWVSTADRDLEGQLQRLVSAHCHDVDAEQGKSGAAMSLSELEDRLFALQLGNPPVVSRLDRMGKIVRGLVELLDSLKERGVAFRSLSEGTDATIPQGWRMSGIIASMAEMQQAHGPTPRSLTLPTTAKRWAARYAAMGEAGMAEGPRSRTGRRTGDQKYRVRKVVQLRWSKGWGPARSERSLPCLPPRSTWSSSRAG